MYSSIHVSMALGHNLTGLKALDTWILEYKEILHVFKYLCIQGFEACYFRMGISMYLNIHVSTSLRPGYFRMSMYLSIQV